MTLGSNFLCRHPNGADPSPLCGQHKRMAPKKLHRINLKVNATENKQ